MSISADVSGACPRIEPVRTPLHSGIGVNTFVLLSTLGAVIPLTAGCLIFGWRAAGATAVLILTCVFTGIIWKHIGSRGTQVRLAHCFWLGVLLAMLLPAHLFTLGSIDDQPTVWPILPATAMTAIILSWLLGGLGAERVSPPVTALLLVFVLFHHVLTPRYVLRLDHLGRGDLLKVDPNATASISREPWINSPPSATPYDSLLRDSVADKLVAFTSAQQRPDRSSITLQMLIRDEMPPLEDLIIGGQSTAIGSASAIGVIIGGLFLLYRGMIDFRLPLLGTLAAIIAMLILPVPVLITDAGPEWHWLAFRPRYVGWPTDLTFVNYELLASPLLLTLFFLANATGLRPMTRRGRTAFALGLGGLSAIFQLYFSTSIGPYVALLIMGLFTPTLDRMLRPKTLV